MKNLDLTTLGVEEMSEAEKLQTNGGALVLWAFMLGFYVGYNEAVNEMQ